MRNLWNRLRGQPNQAKLTSVTPQTIADLFTQSQALYLETFQGVLEDYDDHGQEPEALIRNEDGTPAQLPGSPYPARVDLVLSPEGKPAELHHIRAAQELDHPPLYAALADTRHVVIYPFTWDRCEVLAPLSEEAAQKALNAWYAASFQSAEVTQSPSGSIHSASDLRQTDDLIAFTIDLGTSPPDTLWALITALHDAGAPTVILRKENP